MELESTELEAMDLYYMKFWFKPFYLHQTQGLPGFFVDNAYSIQ